MINTNELKFEMIRHGYTSKTLAEAIGISKNNFSEKLNGKRPFDTVQISGICKLLFIEKPARKAEIFLP